MTCGNSARLPGLSGRAFLFRRTVVSGMINVGVIGCGGFARLVHMPNMKAHPDFNLYFACDIDRDAAKRAAAEFGFQKHGKSVTALLADKNVHLVLITTRHDSHTNLTLKAARAGKHVLCEKPMCIKSSDVGKIMKVVKETALKYTVGYNRGLAPLISKARRIISKINLPIIVYHRMQNPFEGRTHWLLDEKTGGGRMVGEGVHCIDLFCSLIRSEPVRVYAEGGIFTGSEAHHTPDTFAMTLGFEDGSSAALVLSSVGTDKLSKESTEIYCGQTGIVIDLFKRMEIHSQELGIDEVIELPEVDKGHKAEIDMLARAILDDTDPPNNITSAARSAIIGFKAVKSALTGRVQKISREEYTG